MMSDILCSPNSRGGREGAKKGFLPMEEGREGAQQACRGSNLGPTVC